MEKKKCTFIGARGEDLVMFFAKIISRMGEIPVIFDRTKEHRLHTYIGSDTQAGIVEYNGVRYTYGPEECTEATVELFLYDAGDPDDYDDMRVYITDEDLWTYRQLNASMSRENNSIPCVAEGSFLVIRNSTGLLPNLYSELVERLNIGRLITIPFNEADWNTYLMFQHRQVFRFDNVSDDTRDLLLALTFYLYPDVCKKEIKKVYTLASIGR